MQTGVGSRYNMIWTGANIMSQIVEAIFDGTVLRPETALNLEENTRVRLTVEIMPRQIILPESDATSFLRTARSLNLSGPADWSANVDKYLYGDDRPQ
jgi:predicted DNA-binding antitoxin AbrB/MazE fold protein